MGKMGANELCHCGSGKKYKKCCRDNDERRDRRWIPSPEQSESIAQFVRKMQREKEEAKYSAPKYHDFELGGQKFRIVGRGIYPEPHPGQLSDIMVEHLKSQVLGEKWLEDEWRKVPEEQHIVVRWLTAWKELRRRGQQDGALPYVPLTGEAQELLALADDVSRILQTEKRFPAKLRKRLLNRREFQGARYELAVAATFIRCNFSVEWIDDRTGPANKLGKRCDFNAVHNDTGETVAVETKSRRRKGTLHEPGEPPDPAALKADVYNLYREATGQNPGDRPFAIFIDVNLPHQPERQGIDKTWVPDIREILEQYAKINPSEPAPFSFLFVTNFAWHYRGGAVAHSPENLFFYIPEAPHQISQATFDAIGRAVQGYGSLPSGYLKTSSIYPLPVPDSAHHVTVELTIMTHSQSRAKSGSGRTLGQGYRPSYDAPHVVPQPVEIPVLAGTKVKNVVGVWYEPVGNSNGLDGFERLDVAPRADEHKETHFDLIASSRRGVATEVKIRVHILYESG